MKTSNYVRLAAMAAVAAGAVALIAAGTAKAQTPVRSEKAAATRTAATADDRRAIADMFAAYNQALNTSNTSAVISLYTDEGIFMPPYSASAIGPTAVRKAYDHVFKQISFAVRFDIAEIVQIAPDWAFARTNSAGTTTARGTGAKSSEGNQELFVLKKGADARWRIARYSFSPTSPSKD